MVVLGAVLYALGINQLQILDYGMGSFDSLTLQITKLTIVSQFGNASFLIHFIFFVVLLQLIKKYQLDLKMVILSIFSIFILTRVVNVFSHIDYYPDKNIIVFVITFLTLNMGLFLLAKSNFIISPFDKFLVETANHFKINFGIIRFSADVVFLLIVVLVNVIYAQVVPITLFTLIITFLTGVNIAIYEIILNKILYLWSNVQN
ncbi:MAG: hypothetical protein ACK5NF_07870 [Bacilli bacterium]